MAASDQQILTQLNAILSARLTGINQYFLHARMLKHMGELTLADYTYRASIDAMKFSDMLVEHILALGGMPQMQQLGELAIGAVPEAMLCNDCRHAEASLTVIEQALAGCDEARHKATSELLKRMAENQQEHVLHLRALLATHSQHSVKDCA